MHLVNQGKVRDVFLLDEDHLLILATDRLSAYDVVFPDPIPGKGVVLTALTRWWQSKTDGIVPSHWAVDDTAALRALAAEKPSIIDARYHADLPKRAMVVERCAVIPFECVVRGYAFGSYVKAHPEVKPMTRFETPLFTPSTKATEGHDETVEFEVMRQALGDVAGTLREVSIRLFEFASAICERAGIVLVDTKFEFGHDRTGQLRLVDECFTPDSSRFILKDDVDRGVFDSFDKQIVRDYVDGMGWDRKPPAPRLPPDIIDRTIERYRTIQKRITGVRADEVQGEHSN